MLIATAAIVPLAVVYGLALDALLKAQRGQTQASTVGVARAIATAVDSELRMTVAALEALALTEPLGTTTPEGLVEAYQLVTAVRASHPEWRDLLLAAPDGRILFSTERSHVAPGASVVDQASLQEVVSEKRPVIGAMTRGPRGQLAFPVRVPVLRKGELRHVLTAVVDPGAVTAVLHRQRVPEGWMVSVFDSRQARVARNIGDDRLRGTAPSDTLLRLLASIGPQREGVGSTINVEGVRARTAIARMDAAPWMVVLGAAVATSESASRRLFMAYGGGLLISLCFGGLAAWWISRGVTRPMDLLRAQADAVGRGETLPAQKSGVAEVDAVASALATASEQRRRGEAERQHLLEGERLARANAQAAELRLARLADASTALSQSLEEESTLAAIARVIVPAIADLCRIDLLDENGMLERKLTHHFDAARSAFVAQMVSTRTAPQVPGSFPWAISTGKMFLLNLDDAEAVEKLDPQLKEFTRIVGITAGCVVPLVARGRTIGVMAVLQAESQRRFSAEDGSLIGELAQRVALALDNVRLLQQARSAQHQAEQANRSKDEFLAMLGHELRNPLAPMGLALQLMARRDPQAFPRERQIIERQVRHLSRMVDDLLDVSRIVAGKITLKTESVDMRDVVARALELTLPALQERDRMPEAQMPSAPVLVRGDPLRLAQIVGNLLTNAAKFTDPKGSIRILLASDTAASSPQAVLRVVDDGIGITPDLLPRVFERFVQGEQALHRAAGGLGLGLPIAQSLARLHGGEITVESRGAGQGTTFEVRLPLQAEPDEASQTGTPAAAAPPALSLLVVDDNKDAAEALASWLELEGHETHLAFSAEEALELLSRQPCDGAVIDIGLPGMNGYDLAARLRAETATRSMALVALTGYGREADRQRALQAGFDDHFAKPAQAEILLARLAQIYMQGRVSAAPKID
ncbi:ATP-binding protein [Variovorax sp. RA8]|uniref:ATP-binding protein n=1 Tax=Variovorax sp. (strain JCM 16519 / RA8) TaxID=662548 RepID=UPI001317FD62|nr:ATP-binding protein [Variovorax sp. RA8]VTU24708.1 Autoinducer 2 sensor kinase/phosphatase LuxQ [Variovorax sp. RA8]